MCDNVGMNKAVTMNSKSGFMIVELIIALLVLSLIIHPVFVEEENEMGQRTTKVEWELPMAKLLAQVGNFENLIDRSWAGLDRQFGYTGGTKVNTGKFMRDSLQNGIVMMTAGFVNKDGRFTGDISSNTANFEDASKGMVTAFYDAAQEGMRR